MLLKIDLHVHSDRSPDGRSSLPKLISAAKAKGLDGFALTDHDLLSQPMEVDDFLIIPACECSTKDGHIVGLFLSELPRCPKSRTGHLPTAAEAIDEIHRQGGIAIWAHPYERHLTIDEAAAAAADFIETANARADFKNTKANAMAQGLADRLNKPQTGGSDGHHDSEVGNAFTELDCKARTLDEVRTILTAGATQPVLVQNTPRIKKGLSQLEKCRKQKAGLLRFCKAYAYILYCIILDLIKG
ncbi:MAG: PHP domain-containing protein [Clostridia bacterium]|nr:PHP domain-containing protein [Clostridia bacterium]